MDRCALFVDAGYALADGAMAVHGTRRRDSVSWDHAGLLKLLAGLARDRTGLPVLRCYWYETAAEGRRTAEHDALAEMPGLKLRLVNALPGRREGIESQLRRDLVTLAKSGAISDAFIASANEHIAEIVAEVQDLGLRVVILHIASDSGWTIPLPLRQECDDIVEISGVHLRSYVDLIRAEPAGSDEPYKSASAGAVTHYGLPAAALPAPGAVYQIADASEHRPESVGYGSSGTPAMAEPRASVEYPAEQAAGTSAQSSGFSPVYQSEVGVGYQDNAAGSYQNGGAGYQSASMSNGAGSGPVGLGRESGGQAGAGQGGGDHAGQSHGADGSSRVGHGGDALASTGPGSTGPGSAGSSGTGLNGGPANSTGSNGAGPNGAGSNSAGRPNAYPGDPGMSSLAAVGFQQQNAYQRAPGQGGIEPNGVGQNGSGQNGSAGQNGVSYQTPGQNGAGQFGYPVGQPGGPSNHPASSFQFTGAGQAGPSQGGPAQGGGAGQGGQGHGGAGQSGGGHSGAGHSGVGQGASHSGASHGGAGQGSNGGGLGQPQASQPPMGQPQAGQSQPGQPQVGQSQVGQSQVGQSQLGQSQVGLPQPGQSQPGLVQPGLAQPGYPQPGQTQAGQFQPGQAQSGQFQPGQAQSGQAQQGQFQPGQAQSGQFQPGQVQQGQFQPGQVQGQPQPGQVQPGQPQSGQSLPGQPQPGQHGHGAQPVQPQGGIPPVGYQYGPGSGPQNGARGGLLPGGFHQVGGQPGVAQPSGAQPGGAQPDPRGRDPYSSGLPSPMPPGGPDSQPQPAIQYGYGGPDMSFGPGQMPGPAGGPGSDQNQRQAFGVVPGQHQGPDGGPQYQMPPPAAPPLPAVRVQQPVAIALPDAVKAAHAEGFSFGESVGRDAPSLWLEAVLARKPRMPSDLEARLLQGSVLPIDSLLHDEVRHSLRRGFWDALESARR